MRDVACQEPLQPTVQMPAFVHVHVATVPWPDEEAVAHARLLFLPGDDQGKTSPLVRFATSGSRDELPMCCTITHTVHVCDVHDGAELEEM